MAKKSLNWSVPNESFRRIQHAFDEAAEDVWGGKQKWIAALIAMQLYLELPDATRRARGGELLNKRHASDLDDWVKAYLDSVRPTEEAPGEGEAEGSPHDLLDKAADDLRRQQEIQRNQSNKN